MVNGVPDHDWPRSVFYALYVHFSLCGYIVLIVVIADDLFFVQNIFVFCQRYQTLRQIIGLLNYDGERSREKDQRILRDSFEIHVELKE